MNGPSSRMSWECKCFLILDPVDVEKAYRYSASCSPCPQWHVRSYGWRYAILSKDEMSMDWRLILRPKDCTTQAALRNVLKLLQWPVCCSFRHVLLFHSGHCDHLGSGTTELLLILTMTLVILPYTNTDLCCKCRTNTVPVIDEGRSSNPTVSQVAISSPLQPLVDLFNHLFICLNCPGVMKNISRLNTWVKQHPDQAVVQGPNWQPKVLFEYTAWSTKELGASWSKS